MFERSSPHEVDVRNSFVGDSADHQEPAAEHDERQGVEQDVDAGDGEPAVLVQRDQRSRHGGSAGAGQSAKAAIKRL